MLKFFSLPIHHEGQKYFLEPITGSLLSKRIDDTEHKKVVPKQSKISRALDQCNRPYMLEKDSKNSQEMKQVKSIHFVNQFGRGLTSIFKTSFFLGRIFSTFGFMVFDNTTEAFIAYRKMLPGKRQKDLCLPRAFFAASTSKNFKKKGVIFIGVFLPSKNLHAWIIEDGMQPDPFDNMWINYQPVAIFY